MGEEQTHRGEVRGQMETEVAAPSQGCLEPQKLEEVRKDPPLEPWGSPALRHPDSGLWPPDGERISVCPFKPPVCCGPLSWLTWDSPGPKGAETPAGGTTTEPGCPPYWAHRLFEGGPAGLAAASCFVFGLEGDQTSQSEGVQDCGGAEETLWAGGPRSPLSPRGSNGT